jgi:hypothetical protein
MKRRFWTPGEDALLREKYPHMATRKLAPLLDHTLSGINGRATKFGLRKTAEYLASGDACLLRRTSIGGIPYRFKKGHVPANKGLRRPGWFAGRMRETQFKKGQRSGVAARNWLPVGTVRPDPDGFMRRKIAEADGPPYGYPNTKVWEYVHRRVWTEANGPIPPKHHVAFKDGDRKNTQLGNLELVSFADMVLRNSIHNLPPELKETIYAMIHLKWSITMKGKRDAREQSQRHVEGAADGTLRHAARPARQGKPDRSESRKGHRPGRGNDHQLRKGRGRVHARKRVQKRKRVSGNSRASGTAAARRVA